ncbi:putative CRISPR-associated protein [Fervidibacillus halotolerans]|uniref:CRISPR-associated protein n=1 Tax=Fervidibacillus halotolerans TaxID=2980027 RepID=A0A9E8RY94_9BACI|nr:putative CRISPR-associated protein [Fervidibacillus halotolerans]WAA11984.1 putative CRISPR-associated protein [Fervidibacillus halotolerans]
MYHTVVMTCGVSILQGNRLFSLTNDESFEPLFAKHLQEPIEKMTDSMWEEVDRYINKSKLIFHQISENEHAICAEYSMLHTLRKRNKLAKKARIILIVTKTIGGMVSGQLLKELFERSFDVTIQVLYSNMTITDKKALKSQTTEYLHLLGKALSAGEPKTTCFAPIGGYKIMASLGYLVGSFLNYPMSYLHENTQILVEIPPVPLSIDEQFVQEHSQLLRTCSKDYVPLKDLSFNDRQLVENYPAIFTIEEDYVSLSAFGEFLLERTYQDSIFKTQYLLSEQVISLIEKNNHHSIFIFDELQKLVSKLKSRIEIDDLYHEITFNTIDSSKCKFHLYKGASNGSNVFRLAYSYDEKEDKLYANYLWLDHDRYEREVPKGIGLYEAESHFQEYSKNQFVKK